MHARGLWGTYHPELVEGPLPSRSTLGSYGVLREAQRGAHPPDQTSSSRPKLIIKSKQSYISLPHVLASNEAQLEADWQSPPWEVDGVDINLASLAKGVKLIKASPESNRIGE